MGTFSQKNLNTVKLLKKVKGCKSKIDLLCHCDKFGGDPVLHSGGRTNYHRTAQDTTGQPQDSTGHSADVDAVSWLTSYGSWHAYEKKIVPVL